MKRMLLFAFLGAALVVPPHALGQVRAGTKSDVELPVPQPPDRFTVAILADRTTGYKSGLAVLEQAVEELNLLQPELVFHVGDLVPGYIRDMEQWERDIERVKGILNRLEAPLYPVAGNHDVITGTGGLDDHRGEDLFRKHFGPLYYSMEYRDAHFVALYSDEALQSRPSISERQFQWLRDDLDSTDARHIFVFVHKPMWEYGEVGWERVHDLLRRHPVRAVIGGHFHHYYKSKLHDGIQYYVLGVTGGRTFSPELAGGLEHYCLLRVRPDSYELALIKPGGILPDDYITEADYKAMEKLRFLSREQVGVTDSVASPELGPVRETVSVALTNPLDRPLPVTVRAAGAGGPWRFRPEAQRTVLAANSRRRVEIDVQCPALDPAELTVPELEIEYEYLDSRNRAVPVVLRRRVALRRQVRVELGAPAISVDGRGKEAAWTEAPVLTSARWKASPYESEEPGPRFHLLATKAGLYLLADSPDQDVSTFQDGRMLSDAVFVGALADLASRSDLEAALTVVLYPSPATGGGRAVQAPWDEGNPLGMEVEGVYVASRRAEDGGWQCEAFIPWHLLLADPPEIPGGLAFNVGAWDNDGELFTELHSWAPTSDASQWGRLVLEPRSAD